MSSVSLPGVRGGGRRLGIAEDWESLNRESLSFLRLASIRLMLRKLCNPS